MPPEQPGEAVICCPDPPCAPVPYTGRPPIKCPPHLHLHAASWLIAPPTAPLPDESKHCRFGRTKSPPWHPDQELYTPPDWPTAVPAPGSQAQCSPPEEVDASAPSQTQGLALSTGR